MPKHGFGYDPGVTACNSSTTAWSGTGIPVFDTLNFTPGFGTNAFGPLDVLRINGSGRAECVGERTNSRNVKVYLLDGL